MAKVTQKQIAERAGVSQSIVSKVLRGQIPRNMSKAKIQAIHDAVEDLDYQGQTTQPKQKPKPETAPRPRSSRTKFGHTPQGDPIHKYARQWRQQVSAATGLMPSGKFSDLKYGEQKQVMKILNNIDKGTKQQTKTANSAFKLQQKTSRALWQGVGVGLGAVGIPSTIGGAVSFARDLIANTAATGRTAQSLDINPDKMIAMSMMAEKFGAGGKLAPSLSRLQAMQYGFREQGEGAIPTALGKYARGANIGALQSSAYSENPLQFLDEINRQFQQGKIGKKGLLSLLGALGSGDLSNLMIGGHWGQVRGAKAQSGAFESAQLLDAQFGELTRQVKTLAIDSFPVLESAMTSFIGWLDKYIDTPREKYDYELLRLKGFQEIEDATKDPIRKRVAIKNRMDQQKAVRELAVKSGFPLPASMNAAASNNNKKPRSGKDIRIHNSYEFNSNGVPQDVADKAAKAGADAAKKVLDDYANETSEKREFL